jgi:hypothetical protein
MKDDNSRIPLNLYHKILDFKVNFQFKFLFIFINLPSKQSHRDSPFITADLFDNAGHVKQLFISVPVQVAQD